MPANRQMEVDGWRRHMIAGGKCWRWQLSFVTAATTDFIPAAFWRQLVDHGSSIRADDSSPR